ncbi:LOG family protein [Candidatus Gottesmanbacteria bacterium]|nr:LOG family protein [Candidatus Gottesmanbacteria bacterium]
MGKKIVIFAGNECIKEREEYYFSLSYRTGKLLAEHGFTVVSGGGPGLMNEVSRGAYEAGGHTIGICLEIAGRVNSNFLKEKELFHSLRERQLRLTSFADGFLALPGGIGTLYEITEILALKRKYEIEETKPLIILDGYYEEFYHLLEKMEREGFTPLYLNKMYTRVQTPEEAVEKLIEKLA